MCLCSLVTRPFFKRSGRKNSKRVCVCVYVCIRVHVCTCVYVCMYAFVHAYSYVYNHPIGVFEKPDAEAQVAAKSRRLNLLEV